MSSSIHQAIHNSFVTLAQQYDCPAPNLIDEASIDAFAQRLLKKVHQKEVAQSFEKLTYRLRQIEKEQAGQTGFAADADSDKKLVAKVKQISEQLTAGLARSEPPVFLQKSALSVSYNNLPDDVLGVILAPLCRKDLGAISQVNRLHHRLAHEKLLETAKSLSEISHEAGCPGDFQSVIRPFIGFVPSCSGSPLSDADRQTLHRLMQDLFTAYPFLKKLALKDIAPCLSRLVKMFQPSGSDEEQVPLSTLLRLLSILFRGDTFHLDDLKILENQIQASADKYRWNPSTYFHFLAMIEERPLNITYDRFEDDLFAMKVAVYYNRVLLEDASDRLRNDPDLVSLAVSQNGFALAWASKELQNDPHIVRLAVSQDGCALAYASDELQNDPHIVRLAVSQDGCALAYASDELQNDPHIVRLAVSQDGCALAYASDKFQNDPDLVRLAVSQKGRALEWASKELQNDSDLVSFVVSKNGCALAHASKELQNDPHIVRLAVSQDGCALVYASKELQNDPDLVLLAVSQNGYALQYASDELRNNLKIVKFFLKKKPSLFAWVGPKARGDAQVRKMVGLPPLSIGDRIKEILKRLGRILKFFDTLFESLSRKWKRSRK